MCVQGNSSSNFWALPCFPRRHSGTALAPLRVQLSVVKRIFGMMERLLHWCACRTSPLAFLVLPGAGTRISSPITRKRGGEEDIFGKHQEEQQRQFIIKILILTTHTLNIPQGGKLGNRKVPLSKDFEKAHGRGEQFHRAQWPTVTDPSSASAQALRHTHKGTHTTTTAKDWIIFCCFIQQKQRSTKQRMRSKTHTSQLTVQLQPKPQCHLGHLCCTCPKAKLKKKHHQGQGQHPVQSSEAFKKVLCQKPRTEKPKQIFKNYSTPYWFA